MRFFIALEIPEENRAELKVIQQKVRELLPKIRLTDNSKLHLTLAFVGEQPDYLKEQLINVIAQAAREVKAFSVTPAYLDGFPSIHKPHTLWVGVKGDIDKLLIIRERIKDGLENLKLVVDERRFTPHIAIGKFSHFEINHQQEELMQQLMDHSVLNPILVNSIKLFESVPDEGFHTHNTLAEIQL